MFTQVDEEVRKVLEVAQARRRSSRRASIFFAIAAKSNFVRARKEQAIDSDNRGVSSILVSSPRSPTLKRLTFFTSASGICSTGKTWSAKPVAIALSGMLGKSAVVGILNQGHATHDLDRL